MKARTVFAAAFIAACAALVGLIWVCVLTAGTIWSLAVAVPAVAAAFLADRFDQRRSLRHLDNRSVADRISDYTGRRAA